MLILLHAKQNKDHAMKIDDFIVNKNVEPVLVNMRYVKEITLFNQNEISRVRFGFNDWMIGSRSSLWLDHVNALHVIESLEQIQGLIAEENNI